MSEHQVDPDFYRGEADNLRKERRERGENARDELIPGTYRMLLITDDLIYALDRYRDPDKDYFARLAWAEQIAETISDALYDDLSPSDTPAATGHPEGVS